MRQAAEEIWQRHRAQWPGLSVEIVAEVDSTNTALVERVRAGDVAPGILLARRQTAGRGRLGHTWATLMAEGTDGAPPALTFSLALPLPPRDPSGLSLAVGVAAAETLGPAVRVKWPNDLWAEVPAPDAAPSGGTAPLQWRKLGGILIETVQAPGGGRMAVIGLGVNLHGVPTGVLDPPPIDLVTLQAGQEPVAARVWMQLSAAVLDAVAAFAAGGWEPFTARFAQRDALLGRTIVASAAGNDQPWEGVAQGVDGRGHLVVQRAGAAQPVRLLSGEVRVRPC